LLCGVPARPIPAVIFVGSLAAAATTGALIAMGNRVGHAGIPFAAIGAVPFQRAATSGVVGLVFTGFVLHVAAMFTWSFFYVWLANLTKRPILSAIGIAIMSFFSSWLIAWSSGKGLATALPLGDRVGLALLLAAALGVGMRYAFPSSAKPV
jgi:hypothetical protein